MLVSVFCLVGVFLRSVILHSVFVEVVWTSTALPFDFFWSARDTLLFYVFCCRLWLRSPLLFHVVSPVFFQFV